MGILPSAAFIAVLPSIENELAEGEQTKWKLRCGIEIEQGIRQFLL